VVTYDLLRALVRRDVLKTAMGVSLFVGSCLNLINQGEQIFSGSGPDWLRLGLNYLVPFCVSAFSGAKAQLATVPFQATCTRH
jgi:hypothetical protein